MEKIANTCTMESGAEEMVIVNFSDKKIIITLILLWISAFVLYAQSIGFGFINFDDPTILLGRHHLYNENSFLSSLNQILFQSFPREGPMLLRDISWAIDSYLYGFRNPAGYHLGNVLLNSCNIALLFVFLLMAGWSYFYALAITVTYAVLPLHAETVCWVMGRKDLLVTFFMLTGLILQTLYLETSEKQTKKIFYVSGIVVTLLALLSKVNALTWFLVLAAYHLFYPYLKGRCDASASISMAQIRKVIPKYIPHLLISLFVYFWYKKLLGDMGELENGPNISFLEHLRNVTLFTPLVIGMYAKLVFIPAGHSVYYSWPSIHQELEPVYMILSFIILLALICAYVILYIRRKDIFFYALIFFVLMIPYLNITYFGIWLANRYVYFASFCFPVIAAFFIADVAKRVSISGRYLILILWICFVSVNLFRTVGYQQVWKDDHSLWQYETGLKNPSLMAFASLAYSYVRQAQEESEPERKEEFFRQAEKNIEKGFHQFKISKLRKSTPHLFQLYFLEGMMAQLKGESFQTQLSFYAKAYELKPERKDCVRKMAEIHYRIAEHADDMDKKKENAQLSLSYFEKYIYLTKNDLQAAVSNLALLKNGYDTAFPFLRPQTVPLIKKLMERTDF